MHRKNPFGRERSDVWRRASQRETKINGMGKSTTKRKGTSRAGRITRDRKDTKALNKRLIASKDFTKTVQWGGQKGKAELDKETGGAQQPWVSSSSEANFISQAEQTEKTTVRTLKKRSGKKRSGTRKGKQMFRRMSQTLAFPGCI